MADARKMSDEELLEEYTWISSGKANELLRRLAVMRELCEAASCLTDVAARDLPPTKDVIRFFEGIDAYRAMKESSSDLSSD